MICLTAFITALSMAAAQYTGVTAQWNFGLDLGEYYPDRGDGGYHGTNGSSHLNTDKNVVSQQVNRGLYFNDHEERYAAWPSTAATSETLNLHDSTITDYSIGMFAKAINHESQGHGLLTYCSPPCDESSTDLSIKLQGQELVMDFWQNINQDGVSVSINDPGSDWFFVNIKIAQYPEDKAFFQVQINNSNAVSSWVYIYSYFTHAVANPQFLVGKGPPNYTWKGFISHLFIISPSENDMSTYVETSWSDAQTPPVCMIGESIPGVCDITETSGCEQTCACGNDGEQWHTSRTEWNPCSHCLSECSYCRYEKPDYKWYALNDSYNAQCECATGYTFNASTSTTPDRYCSPTVLARWNFAYDLGETFPDRSGNGYHCTNGPSHLTTENNCLQQLNRGLWFNGEHDTYALCPSSDITSQTFIDLTASADYSIAMFVYKLADNKELLSICKSTCDNDSLFDLRIKVGDQSSLLIFDNNQFQATSTFQDAMMANQKWYFINIQIHNHGLPEYVLYINEKRKVYPIDVSYYAPRTSQNQKLLIGRGLPNNSGPKYVWHGFISHLIIASPGTQDMSYFFSDSCPGSMDICMLDPEAIIHGECDDITFDSQCNSDCSCSGTDTVWQLHKTDWDPCSKCPSECSYCSYNTSTTDFECTLLDASLAIDVSYKCECASGYTGYNANTGETPDQYCTLAPTIVCHASCADWSGTSSTDCTLCNTGATLESGSCNCTTGYYQDEAFVCLQCDAACAQCTGPGTESCQQCNSGYYRLDTSWKSTWDIQYYGDTTTNQCVACPTGCNSCSSSTQCTSCIISYFMQPDGLTCSQTCPTAWFADAITQSCGGCPSNCDVCTSATQCTSCTDPYVLRVDGLCYNSCQEAYYADTNRECQQCFGFCATCVGPDSDMCLTWADGLGRSDPFSNQSSCLCGGWASTNKEAKLTCINYNYQQEETSDIDIIDDLNYYIESEDLNAADLQEIVSIVSNLNITDKIFDLTTNTLHEASRKTMISINDTSNSISAADQIIETQANIDTAEDLYGSYVTTDSGSGVRIPSELNNQNLTSSDDVLIASVVSVTSKSNDYITLSDYDIVSVEIEKLVGNQQTEHINYENLTTNFTIIFGGQSFNTSESLECVYLSNSNWITDGCWLDYFSVTRAWCLCNHLSSFSMRKAKSEANQDNNAEATVQFENAANYNLDTNQVPLYVVSTILIIYLTVFIILRRSERQKKQTSPIDISNSSDGKDVKARPEKSDPAQLSNLSCSADSSDAIIRINEMNKTISNNQTDDLTFRWAHDVSNHTKEQIDVTTTRNELRKQEILEKKAEQHKSLKNRFLVRHPFFGVFWLGTDHRMLRSEKLTVLLVIIMTGIFVTGLFYDRDQDAPETEEEDKTFYETIQSFSWADFWIIVFSMSITIPIPIILRNLFRRKKIDLDKDVKSQIRRQKLKRFAGFTLSACIVLWSAWSCISFSLSFGYNTTNQWMLSFLGAEILDLLFKDNITTFIIVILSIIIAMIQMRRKNSKVNIVKDIMPIVCIDLHDGKSDKSNDPKNRKKGADSKTRDAVNGADAEFELEFD